MYVECIRHRYLYGFHEKFQDYLITALVFIQKLLEDKLLPDDQKPHFCVKLIFRDYPYDYTAGDCLEIVRDNFDIHTPDKQTCARQKTSSHGKRI